MLKQKLILIMVVVIILVASSLSWASNIARAGHVDTLANEMAIVADDANRQIIIKVTAQKHRGEGRLLMIDSRGRDHELTRAYRDRAGIVIQPQRDADKVIFLNDAGFVVGGINLASSEVFAIMDQHLVSSEVGSLYWEMDRNRSAIISAFHASIDVLEKSDRMRESDREDIFLASIEMLAGRSMKALAANIIALAKDGHEDFPVAVREYKDDEIMLAGVSLVADEDNTGGVPTGLVADEDNTGGVPTGLVADEDNTGGVPTGLVADEDNTGGVPTGLVMKGMDTDVDLDPAMFSQYGVDGDIFMIID